MTDPSDMTPKITPEQEAMVLAMVAQAEDLVEAVADEEGLPVHDARARVMVKLGEMARSQVEESAHEWGASAEEHARVYSLVLDVLAELWGDE